MKGDWFTKPALIALMLVLALALVGMLGCQAKPETSPKIGVMMSLLPVADFVENTGKDKVAVDVMVPPGASPHTYEPTPSQMTQISKAEVFVKVGSGVEFELVWMDKLIAINKKMLVIDTSKGVTLREMEEQDEGIDPHIWVSPLNAKIMVRNICNGLIQTDPENKDYYLKNQDAYLGKLDALDKDMRNELVGVKTRAFMVLHPAWGYLARDYGLEQIPVEISGKEPSPRDIANLIAEARNRDIKVIFASPQFNRQSADVIAKEIGGRVILIDPLAKDYIANMRSVLNEMSQAME